MGGGSWTTSCYTAYASSKGLDTTCVNGVTTLDLAADTTAQDLFKARRIAKELNPKGVVRQCCDTAEHPETVPVILALDVTGSMGGAAVEVAKKLNEVMTNLYGNVKDVEFCVMGIGDLAYDEAPVQMSQFESDIRIAEHLDKVYFEGGGGGNNFESYTAAWYFGLKHADLDCWKRGKKGIIITMGDEPLNPYLPRRPLEAVSDDKLQNDVETSALYKEVTEKFDVYHLAVSDPETSFRYYKDRIIESYGKYFDKDHFKVVSLDGISNAISEIIINAQGEMTVPTTVDNGEGISW